MATAAVKIGLTPESLNVIERWQEAPALVATAIDDAVTQWLEETAAHIQLNKLSGPAGAGEGGSSPVGLRSGDLRRDLHADHDGFATGTIGTTQATAAYAFTILGPSDSAIKPKAARHLWVPIADNLGPSKQMRMTPRELYQQHGPKNQGGDGRMSIFTSKAGNKVVVIHGEQRGTDDEGNAIIVHGRYKRGKKKGQRRGKLMFVLKDEVVVEGSDALASGVNEMLTRGVEIVNEKLGEVFG